MIDIFVKKLFCPLLFVFSVSPGLIYAQCLDFTGLKQRAGAVSHSTFADADIETTQTDGSSETTANVDRDYNGHISSLVYFLKYCDRSGFALDVGVSLDTSVGYHYEDVFHASAMKTEHSFQGVQFSTSVFVGYEW